MIAARGPGSEPRDTLLHAPRGNARAASAPPAARLARRPKPRQFAVPGNPAHSHRSSGAGAAGAGRLFGLNGRWLPSSAPLLASVMPESPQDLAPLGDPLGTLNFPIANSFASNEAPPFIRTAADVALMSGPDRPHLEMLPEPGSLALIAAGLGALALVRLRFRFAR